MKTIDIDKMAHGYINGALWVECSHVGEFEDDSFQDCGFDAGDLTAEAYYMVVDLCKDYLAKVGNLVDHADMEDSDVGYNLYLTIAGHGAGFWDRGLGKIGEDLSDLCDGLPALRFFVTDENKIEVE